MIISDQNIQLSARHYALAETQKERVHETYQSGQLATREVMRTQSQHETFRASESAVNFNKTEPSAQQTHQQKLTYPIQNPNQNSTLFADQQGLPSNTLPRPLAFSTGQESLADKADKVDNKVTLSPQLIKMIEAIEALMERMTGKPYTLTVMGYNPEPTSDKNSDSAQNLSQTGFNQSNQAEFSRALQQQSSGERITESFNYHEQEFSRFQAQGSVTTADGQTIQFDFNATLQRSFSSSVQTEQTKGLVLTDPLVVNFGGTPAQLTLEKVAFDLNSDGQADQISFLERGSGFLALDKNQDGEINNGLELFGTQSGNGFKDLAQYDSDQNGWIDENDAIFSQLQIWHKDDNGLNQLSGLLELNIGAIYLHNTDSQFSIKDNQNNLLGQVVKSGLFMGEDQTVGSVQQIDLVI